MKYLVAKGFLGFGDRLEHLKMCVKFALDNNLQIYVDWSDSKWSHGSESFYSYFKLVGVPQLNSLDDIPENATYYPSVWKGRVKEQLSLDFYRENPTCTIDLLTQKTLENEADVLVASLGYRDLYKDSTFFANVFRVIEPSIIKEVIRRQEEYNLKKCVGVHIRGTDRIKGGDRSLPVRKCVFNAVSLGAMSGLPMVAVSDDPESFKIWKSSFPQTRLLSSLSLDVSSVKGNHNESKNELKITKNQLNIDCIIDFFTLASCKNIVSTYKDSRFFQEASRLAPFVDTILSS
jgi:hypothetical protein